MPRPLEASLPQIILNDGCRIVLEAIYPDNGDAVADVRITETAIYAEDNEATATDAMSGPFMLVPGPDSAVG